MHSWEQSAVEFLLGAIRSPTALLEADRHF